MIVLRPFKALKVGQIPDKLVLSARLGHVFIPLFNEITSIDTVSSLVWIRVVSVRLSHELDPTTSENDVDEGVLLDQLSCDVLATLIMNCLGIVVVVIGFPLLNEKNKN